MKKSREEILKAIKKTLKSISPEARVILFGSQARGNANPDSDWDILVILDKPKIESSDFDNISFPLYELGWNIGEHFSAKLYTRSDWQKRSFTPFYKNVEKEGILI
ncbi:MAG TPA: nucleotidyltransferase domain-containing protein [Prolixibacteraceae bacterium]|nr:nucleotidyltransferase domain-containing protein [Prolixibacteraceae bacterium]